MSHSGQLWEVSVLLPILQAGDAGYGVFQDLPQRKLSPTPGHMFFFPELRHENCDFSPRLTQATQSSGGCHQAATHKMQGSSLAPLSPNPSQWAGSPACALLHPMSPNLCRLSEGGAA